jgi:pyridoxal-phosphate dependent enzyme family protein
MTTRLLQCHDDIFVKMELDNPGGSHKYRAAKNIIESSIISGKIIPQKTTIIEKTGGNFGLGLLAVCSRVGVGVDLAVGLSFSKYKRKILRSFGAQLIGIDLLQQGMTPREVVEYHISKQEVHGKHYFYTDQFNNKLGVEAHRIQTGSEIARQLKENNSGNNVIFIGCAGTGASFTGTCNALKDHGYNVIPILIEPEGCDSKNEIFVDHRIEGVSVGVRPPFLEWNLISETMTVSSSEFMKARQKFFSETGLLLGNSSAASMAAAYRIREEKRLQSIPIVTIAYDSGLWYDDY